MKTKFYAVTRTAVYNLVNNDFDSVFETYSSEEIYLDLFDDIQAFVANSVEHKQPFGVILGQKALEVLNSSEFIRADVDRQFAEVDDDEDEEELYGGLPLECAMCDGSRCYRHSADISYFNAGWYGDCWECPLGYIKGPVKEAKEKSMLCSGY